MFVKDEGDNGRGWEEGVGGKGQLRVLVPYPSAKSKFSVKKK